MKLLFDENRSYRLADTVKDLYPDPAHMRDLGLLGPPDRKIWSHAGELFWAAGRKAS